MGDRWTKKPDAELALASLDAKTMGVLDDADLDLPPRPHGGMPDLPDGLPDLHEHDLMEAFTKMIAWADYLSGVHAEAAILERNALTILEETRARAILSGWSAVGRESVTIAKAERDLDPEVIALSRVHEIRHATRKLYEVMLDAYERDAAHISRELTRRVGMEPVRQRGNRWSP